jgi:hypothetical protein
MNLMDAEQEFDIISSAVTDRMQEYMAAMSGYPYASGSGKAHLWQAAVAKLDEIHTLHSRLGELAKFIEENQGGAPSAAVTVLLKAGKATGWVPSQAHTSARTLIHEWQERARGIRDPVARASALEWLRRALTYAESERLDKVTLCLNNAKPLLNR